MYESQAAAVHSFANTSTSDLLLLLPPTRFSSLFSAMNFESKRNASLARLKNYWYDNIANKPDLVLALAKSMDNALDGSCRMAVCAKPFDTDTVGEVVNKIADEDDRQTGSPVRLCGLFYKLQEATEAQIKAFKAALREHDCMEAVNIFEKDATSTE